MTKISPLDQLKIDDAWLGIEFDDSLLPSPLRKIPEAFRDEPHLWLIYNLGKPEYFGAFCKEILNVELHPFQTVILQELWGRRFPMLVGSRGMSKCVRDAFIVSEDGFCKIDEIIPEDYAYNEPYPLNKQFIGESGFNNAEYIFKHPKEETIKIKTYCGYEIESTKDHPIRVLRDDKVVWLKAEEIKLGDIIPIDRSTDWFKNTNDLTEDVAYLFGCLVGDGGYTVKGHIVLTNIDSYIVERCSETALKLWGKTFRQQKCKINYLLCGVKIWDELFQKYGFNSAVCGLKDFPKSILSAKKEVVAAFIRGLFDTDGHATKSNIKLTAKSKNIIKTLQFVLTRFGIISTIRKRFNKKYERYYYCLTVSGFSLRIFKDSIGFGLKRKQDILEDVCSKESNENLDLIPKQLVNDKINKLREAFYKENSIPGHGYSYERKILAKSRIEKYSLSYKTLDTILKILFPVSYLDEWKDLKQIRERHLFYDRVTDISSSFNETFDLYIPNDHSFISNGFISHNSFLLGVYSLLRMVLIPGRQIVIAGAAFRQSKIIFEYAERILDNSPILRSALKQTDGATHSPEMWSMKIGKSVMNAIPIGTGDTIRGLRAQDVFIDEMKSQNKDILENVIFGFASVKSSPVEGAKKFAAYEKMKSLGMNTDELDFSDALGNQIVLSGTAFYSFNHFAEYWKTWKKIIQTKGDPKSFERIFGTEIPEFLNWKDFSVIRIPYNLLPKGFMDDQILARAKVSMHSGNFAVEYEAIFSSDSSGFFKRSLIESCTTTKDNPISVGDTEVWFDARMFGDKDLQYVIGIDPASEMDNFAIAVIEVHRDHRRIVHLWTTNRKEQLARLRAGLTSENDYYSYCARKIRELMQRFNVVKIVIDEGGGGREIAQTLRDTDKLKPGEQILWPTIDPEKPKDEDTQPGLHIIQQVNFSRFEWVSSANHSLRLDFEQKTLLFPYFNPAVLAIATEQDRVINKEDKNFDSQITLYDTYESCLMNIEELKDELASIIVTRTANGRERWDTPEVKGEAGKRGKQKKDRYSALLLANSYAREIYIPELRNPYSLDGLWGKAFDADRDKEAYNAPEWFKQKLEDAFDEYG